MFSGRASSPSPMRCLPRVSRGESLDSLESKVLSSSPEEGNPYLFAVLAQLTANAVFLPRPFRRFPLRTASPGAGGLGKSAVQSECLGRRWVWTPHPAPFFKRSPPCAGQLFLSSSLSMVRAARRPHLGLLAVRSPPSPRNSSLASPGSHLS